MCATDYKDRVQFGGVSSLLLCRVRVSNKSLVRLESKRLCTLKHLIVPPPYFLIKNYILCVWLFCLHLYTMHMPCTYKERPEEEVGPLELELQTVVSCHVGAGN